MTENEVIVMLSEAIDQDREYKSWHVSTKHLMIFAEMVQKIEREACALICDKEQEEWGWDSDVVNAAIAIRARGQA